MLHHFKYTLKTLFKDKALIFWTFAFPLILGTFFYMAFSDIEKSEQLDIIDIAIIDNDEFKNNKAFQETFRLLSDENSKERLFSTQYTTLEEANSLLENNEITGYLLIEDEPKIVVASNGVDETILKYVVLEITQIEDIVSHVILENMNEFLENSSFDIATWQKEIYQEVLEIFHDRSANIVDVSNRNLSYTMIEFYTLIAMTCLYGGILGMVAINQSLANMSNNGKRVAISPTAKGKIILSSVFASYLVQLVGVFLLFIYTIFILQVDYGNNFPLIILLTLLGSFAGLTLGVAIATLLRANENLKTGIMLAITMFGCFLSGMMGITMKYIVDTNVPLLNKINPASMITDGFYSLYYYGDNLNRFYFNVVSLIIFSLLMIIISMIGLRRQRYDSI